MALLGSESWDIQDTPDITDRWQFAGANTTIVGAAGRCGSAALHFNSAVGSGPWIGVEPGNDGGYTGFAFQPGNFDITSALPMLNINNHLNQPQIIIRLLPTGAVEAYSGPQAALVDSRFLCRSSPGLITAGHYYHIGVEWLCVTVGGYVKIWVNGVLVTEVSGVNTRTGTAFATSAPWTILNYVGRDGYMDDMYWGDTTGSAPRNAFLGDLRVQGQIALSDADGGGGSNQDFTVSSGSDHGDMVDDAHPDDDATYLESDNPGDTETFIFEAITLNAGVVYGIETFANVKKTDSGDRTIKHVVVSTGGTSTGDEKGLSQTAYNYQTQMWEQDPTTLTDWDATTANAMEAGITVNT